MSCKVYVGNLAWATDDPTLGAHFSSVGTVKDAVVMRSEGRSRGFGFVTFSSVQEAEQAIVTMNDTELQGRRLRVNVASQQLRPSAIDWSANGGGPSYMPYSPAQYPGGGGAYQSPPFGGQYTQPGFAGYPSGSGYNPNSTNGGPQNSSQPGYYQHSAAQYQYPSANYNQHQQQQQPY